MSRTTAEDISTYVRALARTNPGAFQRLRLSTLKFKDAQWRSLARSRLLMRQTSIWNAFDDFELEAVAKGTVNFGDIVKNVALETELLQAQTRLQPPSKP